MMMMTTRTVYDDEYGLSMCMLRDMMISGVELFSVHSIWLEVSHFGTRSSRGYVIQQHQCSHNVAGFSHGLLLLPVVLNGIQCDSV